MEPADPRAGPALETRAVRRTFQGRRGAPSVDAIRGVSVVVERGELVALAGPSGSGKTTLLHLLATIDRPTAGTVLVEGRDAASLSPGGRADLRLRRLGLVFSDHNLSPALTVAENVDLPLAVRGIAPRERDTRVRTALQRLGVGGLAARFPESLSSGEAQRVAFARAIAGDPVALLADEPTAHLDSDAAAGLLATLATLVNERGLAAVVATHDVRILARATRVVRLCDGAAA